MYFTSLGNNPTSNREREFTEEEVWETIRSCDENKTLRHNGFNLIFFKSQWEVIKEDIMVYMEKFYRTGKLKEGINNSFIMIIPKKSNPTLLNEFKPISLVGIIYKIITKMLANRLRVVIGEVIGINQFAFTKGRQILDCSFTANEVIDLLKKEEIGGLLFKVDFEKAYDNVN